MVTDRSIPISKTGIPLSRDVAIDLGTSSVQVIEKGRGLIVEEPTVIAVERRSGEVKDFGRSALYLANTQPDGIELVWPMANGSVADPIALQRLLARILHPLSTGFMSRLRAMITISSTASASPNERRAIRDAARRAGASTVELMEHVVAAALGADLPIHEPIGTFVLDVGAGITEAALLSLGCVVTSASVRAGSNSVDLAIKSVLRRDYGMIITDLTAEEIKLAMSANSRSSDTLIEARGQMAIDGSTMTAIIERSEVQAVLDDYLDSSVEAVRRCLISVSPELAQDLITRGIYLVGGGAQLGGLAERLTTEFSLPTYIVEEPERVIVAGAAKCLEDQESLHSLFLST